MLYWWYYLLEKLSGGPRDVAANERHSSKRVRTPVALINSLSNYHLWKIYESSYPTSYGLNGTTTVFFYKVGFGSRRFMKIYF